MIPIAKARQSRWMRIHSSPWHKYIDYVPANGKLDMIPSILFPRDSIINVLERSRLKRGRNMNYGNDLVVFVSKY